MIGQTGEGLDADDVAYALVQKLHHFAAQEPPFAVLIAERKEGLDRLGDPVDPKRRGKALAIFKRFNGGRSEFFQRRYADLGDHRLHKTPPQIFMLVILVVNEHGEKVHKIRDHRFRALALEQLHKVIVCERHILDKDLPDDADLGLFFTLVKRQFVKVFYNALTKLFIRILRLVGAESVYADLLPFVPQSVGGAGSRFIWAGTVEATHHHVSENECAKTLQKHRNGDMKTLVLFHTVRIERYDGNMGKPGFGQRPPDKPDVVARTAAAAGLGHQKRDLVCVVPSGEHSFHHLPGHHD